MATRLPYYSGQDDIYSQLMAQFAQQTPYYSASPYSISPDVSGLLGGYNASLYSPASQSATTGGGLLKTQAPQLEVGPPGLDPTESNAQAMINSFGANGLPNAVVTALVPIANALNISGNNGLASLSIPGAILGNAANIAQMTNMSQIAESNSNAGAIPPAALAASQALTDGMLGSGVDMGAITAAEQAAIDAQGSHGEGQVDTGPVGGGDGGGGSKMICTKLHYLGKMPEDIFIADQAFGALMAKSEPETYAGYAIWARHVVCWMGREDWIGKTVVAIVHKIATPWSVAMAEEMGVDVKSGWFGRFLMKRGLQMCRVIGKMNQNRSLQNV